MATTDMNTVPERPAQLIYDPANAVQGASANESVIARAPRALVLEGLLQAKLTYGAGEGRRRGRLGRSHRG